MATLDEIKLALDEIKLALDDIKLAMTSTSSIFLSEVVGKRNFAALDRVYTADAQILPPGSPAISGLADITAFWTGAIISLDVRSATLTTVEAIPAGEDAVEIGAVELVLGDDSVHVQGKYVVYWKCVEGQWKWHVDIWNLNA